MRAPREWGAKQKGPEKSGPGVKLVWVPMRDAASYFFFFGAAFFLPFLAAFFID